MKSMRLYITIVFLIGAIHLSHGQLFSKERLANLETFDSRLLSWGYFLGFNSYDFKFTYNRNFENYNTDIEVAPQAGFNVGLIGDLRINNYLNLRLEPGIYFTQRNLTFPRIEEESDYLREVKSTYVHLPLLLKVSTKRLNNFKPFVVGGISKSINLGSNENNPEDNYFGQFRMTRNTNYYELGFGVDFYLYYFKFSPSIRGVFATSDELVPDRNPLSPWTSNIASMKTRGVFINFTFQ